MRTPEISRLSLAGAPLRWSGLLLAAALAGCVVAPARRPPPPVAYAPPPPAPMYFYPERGQPEPLQERDRYECYRLAVRDSGVDPGMTPISGPHPAPPAPVARTGGEVVAGAATGAIVGAAVSSPRRTGEAAVLGAIFGAALGAIASESRAQAIEQAEARRAAAAERARMPMDNFRRAMTACMQSRGYRVG